MTVTDPHGTSSSGGRPVPTAPVEDGPSPSGEQWHRLSPRMLLVHPIIEVGRALPALVGAFFAGSSHGDRIGGLLWGLGVAAIVATLAVSRWFTTRLRITPDGVELRHGLLRRRTVATARSRIRTVDVTSHVLHRVLGLARVVVGTGTNDKKGQHRIVLDGLTVATAHQLRTDLLHRSPRVDLRKTDRRGARSVDDVEKFDELAGLDRRWIRYAPFSLSGVVTGLVIWGVYWRVQGESDVNLARTGPLHALGTWLSSLPTAAEVLVLLAAVLVFIAITSTVGYVLAFWDFRLLRHDGGTLEVRRGLLTTRATSIERRRLVGVALSEPLPLRAVGAVRVTAVATGLRTGRGAERGGEVLLPPAPRTEGERVASLALDGSPAVTTPLWPHGARARRRRLLRATFGGVVLLAAGVAATALGGPLWLLVVGALLGLVSLPLGVDRYRNLGHAIRDGHLVVGRGSLVRRRAVLSADAVIGATIRSTPFQRRAGIVTVEVTTAAGRQGYEVQDVVRADALRLLSCVTGGLEEQFLTGRPGALPAT